MNQRSAFIIEDDRELGVIFAEIMELEGWQTDLVQDGRRALERLATNVPDVVVLDLHLPHVSGLDILTQIRRDARLEETKVLIVTADATLAQFAQAEADHVLIKPISADQLNEVTRRLIGDDP